MVTVGIPVYNEAKYLKETIDSVINNIEHIEKIIITDNASTDSTQEICEEYAKKHDKIVYIRHQTNLGAVKNFRHSLMMANTPYFIWVGGHDMIPKGYIANLMNDLKNQPDAVLAYCPSEHISKTGSFVSKYEYFYNDKLKSNNVLKRIFTLVKHLEDCSLVHGLFNTEILKKSYIDNAFIGCDHVILCKAAELGKFVYVEATKYLRREVREEINKTERWKTMLDEKPIDSSYDLYKGMKDGQINIIKNHKANVFLKIYYLIKTYIVLRIRFG